MTWMVVTSACKQTLGLQWLYDISEVLPLVSFLSVCFLISQFRVPQSCPFSRAHHPEHLSCKKLHKPSWCPRRALTPSSLCCILHTSVEVPLLDCVSRALMQSSAVFYSKGLQTPDLMPDEPRWSWCKNNRNKVQNTCDVLESSWKHPPSMERWPPSKLVPGTKKAGESYSRAFSKPWQCADSLIILHLRFVSYGIQPGTATAGPGSSDNPLAISIRLIGSLPIIQLDARTLLVSLVVNQIQTYLSPSGGFSSGSSRDHYYIIF